MASAKLMIPQTQRPYYVLTANVTVHGERVRRYQGTLILTPLY